MKLSTSHSWAGQLKQPAFPVAMETVVLWGFSLKKQKNFPLHNLIKIMSKYTHLHSWHDWQDLESSIKILPHQNISEKRSALNSDITHETVHQFLGGLAIKSTSSVTINLCSKSLAHQRLIEYLLNLYYILGTQKTSHGAPTLPLPSRSIYFKHESPKSHIIELSVPFCATPPIYPIK